MRWVLRPRSLKCRAARSASRAYESFAAFVDRVGKEPFEAIVERFAAIVPFDPARPAFYQDWERTALYKVERGEGECAM